ncbi:hypothetical protein U2F26_28865 [Micromonospora sp. 4G57]|uniref:DUF2567 domain-containing protein n=1 Tax=Micromonospora sicca TaxID=2202420 RepID=A0ABU5JL68_9ACTN|nr:MULTISPECIES: hypothetical protein [unclassified Micromonospora]MDZ5446692.1 hypothetical protein [Micromonospora sp. 4G57]MDZ5493372.1 hypothetical protein [Micromonospora sp. 4G53]
MHWARTNLSPLAFAAVALLFALPFAALKGEAEEWRVAVTWTGWGLTVGGGAQVHLETLLWDGDRGQYVMQEVPNEAPQIGPEEPIYLPGQPLFMVAALGVLAGVLARILAGVKSRLVVSAVAAFVAAGALALGLRGVLRRFDPPPYDEAMSAVPAVGFWLAVGILALLGVGNAIAAYRLRRRGEALKPELGDELTG